MYNFIFGLDQWKKTYKTLDQDAKKNVWIVAQLSNQTTVFLKEYSQWLQLKDYVESNKFNIVKIGLRYKSHQIEKEVDNADAVYVVRSILGQVGADTKQTYTIGLLDSEDVMKTVWFAPELVEQESYKDTLQNCFKEALIYNVTGQTKAKTI